MRQVYRRALIGVLFALSHVIRWQIGTRVSATTYTSDDGGRGGGGGGTDELSRRPPRSHRQHKVFGFQPVLALQQRNSSSSSSATATTLVPAGPGEEHLPEVIWSTQTKALLDVLPLAVESMYARLERGGRIIRPPLEKNNNPDAEVMKSILRNFTQEELNSVDPGWQIFILEHSDGGMGVWPYWFMQHEMAPLLGWNRINYATRSTQNERNMNLWIARLSEDANPGLSFDDFYGRPLNFTAMNVVKGEGTILGRGCRSIQTLGLSVREDMVDAIDGYMKDHHPSAYQEAASEAAEVDEGVSFRLSWAVSRLQRPIDVRTFWNASVCNLHCSFRNRISEIVDSIPQRHPGSNIRTNTDVIGFIHREGRQRIHPDFVTAMMTTKIIVLAQRDHWEGHSRLYEALLSGALVMSDPQVYWPHGTIDGENIVVYNSWSDLEIKVLHYLDPENEEERKLIGMRGREVALRHHRSWTQAERLFLNDMGYRNEYGLSNKPWQ